MSQTRRMAFKALILDGDGMVVTGESFRVRRARDYGIPDEVSNPFFSNEFQKCLVGQLDLKEELARVLPAWGWTRGTDEFLDAWFDAEKTPLDERFLTPIRALKEKGIPSYLATNNEKYRSLNLLEQRGMRTWFEEVFPSAYVGSKKPETAFYDHIASALDTDRSDILYFDDDGGHVEAALKYGFNAHLYTEYGAFEKVLAENA